MHKSNQIKSNQIKSNQIKSNSIILLFSFLFCGIFLTLTSCKNFLNAADVAEEIKEAIEIANSTPTTIYIEAPKDSGTLSQTQVKVKRKESFDLKFIPSDNWKFITWEVFDPTTETIVQDYIKFDDKTKTEVKAKLIKAADKLIIRPKCLELPAVLSYTPSSESSYYTFTPIVITFNRQMENPDTPAANSIFKYDANNISLKVDNTPVNDYFEDPVIDSTKTILTLTPKGNEFLKFINDRNLPYVDVNVSFGSAIAFQEDSLTLPLIKNDNSTIYVRYKGERETEPPKIVDYFVTNKPFTLATVDSISDEDKFLFKQWENFTEEDGFRNCVSDSFYIYGYCNDIDSGIDSVQLSLTRENKTETYLYTREKNNMEYEDLENGYFKFCINLAIGFINQATTIYYSDIEMIVTDKTGNETKSKSLSYTNFNRIVSFISSKTNNDKPGITIEKLEMSQRKFLYVDGGRLVIVCIL